MTKLLGNDYRLWIESGTPDTYNLIKGQQTLTVSRTSNKIDTTDKSSGTYATSTPGLMDLTISCEGIADLPDANGFTLLETNFIGQDTKKFQIRKDGASGDGSDVVFAGTMNIDSLNINYGQNDVVKYSTTLSPASAPTTDALA